MKTVTPHTAANIAAATPTTTIPGLAATMLGYTAVTPSSQTEAPKQKTCPRCGRTLPIAEFGRNLHAKDGHFNICKDCHRAACLPSLEKANQIRRRAPKPGIKATLSLADFTDMQLVAEFQRRGFQGKISKLQELSI